ncbi:MAG: helix-turn-helix domain-containing protein [Acidimicrobiales bacterium]
MEFAHSLRETRLAAGLSQADLARRAGTSQARLSSYENGSVIPTPGTRERLQQAARPLPSIVLDLHRDEVKRLAATHKLGNVRVFGSVARGQDTLSSDIDLLVTPNPVASLLDLSAFAADVEDLLGYEVDVTSDRGVGPESSIARDALFL